MCVVDSDDGDIILPLTIPAIDIDALVMSLADASLSVSGLSYTFVDVRALSVVVVDVRDCFTFYLDATFVQAADINSVLTNFIGSLSSRVSVTIDAFFAGQFELFTSTG